MQWLERCMLWLMDHPQVLIGAGKGLFGLAAIMMFLGLLFRRFGNRLDRAAERTNTTAPHLLEAFPWPIQMLTPETAAGWVMVVVTAGTGIYLVWLGRWAKRL